MAAPPTTGLPAIARRATAGWKRGRTSYSRFYIRSLRILVLQNTSCAYKAVPCQAAPYAAEAMNPKSEVDRCHSAPSFGAHGLPALGAASMDAARIGTVSPSAPKHGTDCLALKFGFRDERQTAKREAHEPRMRSTKGRSWKRTGGHHISIDVRMSEPASWSDARPPRQPWCQIFNRRAVTGRASVSSAGKARARWPWPSEITGAWLRCAGRRRSRKGR